jgi:uncharacterized membrane protein
MHKEDAFFGTKVSLETYQGIGNKIRNRYWFWLTLTFIQIEILGFMLSTYRSGIATAWFVNLPLLLIAGLIFYVIFARQVKPYQVVDETIHRFATVLKVRHLSDYTNIALEVVIGLCIIIPTLVLIYYYPLLPDRIPVHWDINGHPNRWAEKSFISVFMLPLVTIYLQGLFWLLKHGMIQVKMTLPAEHTAEYLECKEESLRVMISLLDQIRLLQVILLGTISLSILSSMASGISSINGILLVTIISDVVILFICGYNIYRMMEIEEKLKTLTGTRSVQRESEAEHWYLGGLFYYNPEDPALFLEKRIGFGYTMNFANKSIFLYFGYIILLPIGIFLLTQLGKI